MVLFMIHFVAILSREQCVFVLGACRRFVSHLLLICLFTDSTWTGVAAQ